MWDNVEDALAKSVWEIAGRQKESEFLEEVESTVNRLGRFLSTQVMRATLCQCASASVTRTRNCSTLTCIAS